MILPEQQRNRLAVLKAIRQGGPVARSALPGLTGLSAGTITAVTAGLVRNGLVVEQREAAPTRGRPRVNLSIDAGGAIVVGAALVGVGMLSVAFVDLAGSLLHQREVKLARARTLPDMARVLSEALGEAMAASPYARTEIGRIGLALPALVNARTGTVHYMSTMPPDPVPFAGPIAEALGIPVTIENDIAVMARAEHWFGRAQALDSFTLVNFDYALGSARYVDGLPWSGANGIATEIGHTKIDPSENARACYCGGRGCASSYCSIFGLLAAAGWLEGLAFPALKRLDELFDQLLDRAEAGDGEILALLDQAAKMLAMTVANHVNASDPGAILMLMRPRLRALLSDRFKAVFAASVMPGMGEATRLIHADPDPDWRWKGTAALALEQTFLAVRDS